ncbi:MAG: hypothetical protein SFV18_07125 [Bryobacteraceae bacterium]|nr:hypothetical protein [Bryobacteraceae bacterium]
MNRSPGFDVDREDRGFSRAGADAEERRKPLDRQRSDVRYGRQIYSWSELERAVLAEIGKFRTLDESDVQRVFYGGMERPFRQDQRHLIAQGLVQRRAITVGKNRDVRHVVVLTKRGKRLLHAQRIAPTNQALYAGFVKPAEASHDASVYAMYEAEASRLNGEGNTIRRVVLDFEFKRAIFAELNRPGDYAETAYKRREADIAARLDLPIVEGKVALPDLRIEYEAADGELRHIDLELATEHYRPSHIRSKVAAGFKLYGTNSTSRGRRAEWEGRELTAGVLAL